jgi:HSP20 family protein
MAKRPSKENARGVKQAKGQPARAAAIKKAPAEKQPASARAGGPSGSGGSSRSLSASGAAASPFGLMRRFAEGMDRLFGDFRLDASPRLDFPFRGAGALAQGVAWAPRVDVVEQGGKFVIRADLPGLTKNDVKVEVSDDAVAIRGERRQEKESKGKGFYHSERSYGSFYRAIPLPEGVDADQATATFRNGVLEVSMPAPTRSTKGRPVAIEE